MADGQRVLLFTPAPSHRTEGPKVWVTTNVSYGSSKDRRPQPPIDVTHVGFPDSLLTTGSPGQFPTRMQDPPHRVQSGSRAARGPRLSVQL